MMYGYFLTLFILGSDPDWLLIASSQDRCVMQDCSVEVITQKPKQKYFYKKQTDRTSIFYQEEHFSLDSETKKLIKDFVDEHPNKVKFVVTGYTDGCGTHQYNKELSRKRANEVSHFLLSIRPSAFVEMRWVGEASGKHTIKARRVDISVTKKVRVPFVPPKIIADFYLIDSSGSMNDKWDAWIYAIKYWKPNGARVFVSTTEYIPKGSSIDSIKPNGGTEIWLSYYQILDKMKPGQRLVIISDFDSEVRLSAREYEMISNKAKAKGVKIQAIPL
jgi:hypothetical protein